MFGLDFSGTRANSCKHKRSSRLMRLELSCARFILVEVSLHEKNSSGSSGGFGALRRTTGSCRGRLWNPVAIPIPCLDSFRPLRPRKPWQLPAGSGSTPARIPFQRFIELLQIPLESVFAVILPVIGIARDVVLDGAKAVIGTVFVATLLLPYLAPSTIVQQIRAERARGS
jgi:hypothetical protein